MSLAARLREQVNLRAELTPYGYALLPQWLQEEANHGRTSFPLFFLRAAQGEGIRTILEREGFTVVFNTLEASDDPEVEGPRLSGMVSW